MPDFNVITLDNVKIPKINNRVFSKNFDCASTFTRNIEIKYKEALNQLIYQIILVKNWQWLN